MGDEYVVAFHRDTDPAFAHSTQVAVGSVSIPRGAGYPFAICNWPCRIDALIQRPVEGSFRTATPH